jgi:hypothetical protein
MPGWLQSNKAYSAFSDAKDAFSLIPHAVFDGRRRIAVASDVPAKTALVEISQLMRPNFSTYAYPSRVSR